MKAAIDTRPSLKDMYSNGVEAIIRPHKNVYSTDKLGPLFFKLQNGRSMRRLDQSIPHGYDTLELSMFLPYDPNRPSQLPINLILFCHCNASNRLQCLQYLEFLPLNYGIAGFDFLGCGNSKDTYISLGLRQSSQIRTIIKAIELQFASIIPWGRSMGATSVLLYGKAPISVVDSPFSSLKELGSDLINKRSQKQACLLDCLFPCLWRSVRKQVKARADFDISKVNATKAVKNMSQNQSIIFIVSKNDELVPCSHAERLYKIFPGKKKALLKVEGDHNTLRRKELFDEVVRLVEQYSSNGPSSTSSPSRDDVTVSATNLA